MLDTILVEAAADAGVEVRQSFAVDSLVFEDGVVRGIRGRSSAAGSVVERARVVIGADGVNSLVARSVKAPRYNEVPALEALYLAYWSGLPTDGEFQIYARDQRAMAAVPTNDGLTVVLVAWPIEEFEANRRDLLGNYLATFGADRSFAARIARAKRESRVAGAVMHNFYRQSHGPGWSLVGDAGYHKDANTAQGITDAFLDAERLVEALDDVFSGKKQMKDALAARQELRDRTTLPMFQLTCRLASFGPPDTDTADLMARAAADRQASEDFASVIAGTMLMPEFFNPANIARYAREDESSATAA